MIGSCDAPCSGGSAPNWCLGFRKNVGGGHLGRHTSSGMLSPILFDAGMKLLRKEIWQFDFVVRSICGQLSALPLLFI